MSNQFTSREWWLQKSSRTLNALHIRINDIVEGFAKPSNDEYRELLNMVKTAQQALEIAHERLLIDGESEGLE